jgi:RNA exonuclease 1
VTTLFSCKKIDDEKAIISAIANLKRRPKPNNLSHPSVGTTGQVAKREIERNSIRNLVLSRDMLIPLLLSDKQMSDLGYVLDLPPGEGGDLRSHEGMETICDRCSQIFTVKVDPDAPDCTYHWGKIYSIKVPGEKEKKKVLTCCSQEKESRGCTQGPHVFYEKEDSILHSRFPFMKFPDSETGVDVVALDCEMIYTTGGMRLAHVSVVDSSGNTILDEPVRLEEDIKVM